MPLIIPPGFTEVAIELRATGDPDPWYVTYGVDSSEAEGNIQAIGQTSIDAWTPVMTVMSDIVTFSGVKLTVGQDGEFPIRQFVPTGTTVTGGDSNGKLPSNCALLVRKNSNIGGRRARGRMFVPLVLGETVVDNVGVITGGALTSYQAKMNGHFVELQNNAIATPMVILHSSGGQSPPGDPTVVTSVQCDNVIATQRRRLR